MYRIDVYTQKRVKKKDGATAIERQKVSSHWYPTEKEAKKAGDAIYKIPYGTHVFVPREGRPPIARDFGGYTTSKPILDNTFK